MESLVAPTEMQVAAAPALPRVSCIMPTRDRRYFVGQAIRYFLRQDYADTELIVVDDGYDSVRDLMPDDPRVIYVRLDSTRSIGAKRNIACARATGDIIAHWDDDDWSSPLRLRTQVMAMLEADADACGITTVLHYRLLRGDGWLYTASPGRASVAGCSIVYRRSAWSINEFAEVNLGEDTAFMERIPAGKVVALADPSLMVAVIHGGNTSAAPIGTPQWAPANLDDIAGLLGEDRPFYSRMRGGKPAPVPPRSSEPTVSVVAPFHMFSGYGVTAEYLALSLARAGASVRAIPLGMSETGLTPELVDMTKTAPRGSADEPLVFHSWMRSEFDEYRHRPNVFVSTMFETTRLPPEWVPRLRTARAVIVPTSFVAEACRASGVDRPVVVVPLGADPDVYHWQPRADSGGFTALIVGPDDQRKHTRLAVAAWKTAFAGDPDARLVIKTTYGYNNFVPDDPRITYVDRVDPARGIAEWYRAADVLLALGNEGFGLPMVEAMSTGLPVIALDAEGQADVCRDAPGLVLPVPGSGRQSNDLGGGVTGFRSVPDFDTVVRHLRWVSSHRAEARDLGRAASAWVATHRNIWSLGAGVLDVVRSSSSTAKPRNARVLWATTAGTPCGVGAFTERLHQSLSGVGLTAAEPPITPQGIVHIQHESSIISDAVMDRVTVEAQLSGASVVVTEHSVVHQPAPWEHHAAALIAATRGGAAVLRARNPAIPVVHIPLGCETWSFPRKPKRGRTIGFFGFPGAHKGHGRLAEALSAVKGCDVVMFGYGPGARQTLHDWPADVPVEWPSAWMPLAEVAASLAARADVLVFHYDAIQHFSASSAVLLGLSTGVPVLTSDTSWFDDQGAAVMRAGVDSSGLATGLERLLEDDALRETTTGAARDYCANNSWSRVAARHVDLWNSLATV